MAENRSRSEQAFDRSQEAFEKCSPQTQADVTEVATLYAVFSVAGNARFQELGKLRGWKLGESCAIADLVRWKAEQLVRSSNAYMGSTQTR